MQVFAGVVVDVDVPQVRLRNSRTVTSHGIRMNGRLASPFCWRMADASNSITI
jgi:hypothetical protein